MRVIDTPISETGFIGIATGAAMAGMRPIVEIAFVDFIGVCFNQIFNFAAKTHYMSGGQFRMPLTMMIGYGGGYNDAAQHSQCLIATLAHVPGIRIATPADSYDAKGLMHTCLRDDNLTIWMVHKRIWGLVVADEDYMNCGVTAEVLAVIAERGPHVLKAPAIRVAYPDVPVPFSRPMENLCLPDPDKLVAAAKKTLGKNR